MQIQRGTILIAPPNMLDSRFRHAVILITEHNEDGTWGLVLNRPSGTTTQQMLSQAQLDCDWDLELYWGGPVSPGVLWLLHKDTWSMSNTLQLGGGWAMTSHMKMFEEFDQQGLPSHWRLFYGFAGWSPGQLEAELEGRGPWRHSSSWLVADSLGPEWAFDQDPETLWESALQLSSSQAVREWL